MADSCAQYVNADDLKAAKESIAHIEHVASSKDANGNPALVVTDPIRGTDYTNTTLDGLFADVGFKPVNGSFEDGGELKNRWDVLLYETNGSYYQWMGTLPHTVPAGSSPFDSSGQLITGWVDQTDLTLRSQLASASPGNGDALIGVKQPFIGAVPRTQHDVNTERVSVKSWNVKGDGIADETEGIQTACNDLQLAFLTDGIRRTLVFPDGSYRTSSTIVVHANMSIECSGKVVFQNRGSDKTFPAFELQGGARRNTFGIIDAYGAGIRILANTNEVEFHTISNCVDGIVIRADTNVAPRASLDNVVRGILIGKCTNGIVFEQNANSLVQQGNEVRLNFITETQNSLLFRNFDGFAHTQPSNWDSNYIELIASDPTKIADAALIRNSTSFGVPNVNYSVRSWCGGWTPDAGTICLIRGAFSTGTFYFSLAARIGLNELVDSAGRGSFGSCAFHVPRYENLGAASAFYQAVTPGASFNGGVAIYRSKFRIRVTIPDLSAGQTYGLSFWHIVAQVSGVGRLLLEQFSDAARGRYNIEVRDAGAEQLGMVRLWITNYTTATVTGRDVDLIIKAS